MFNLNELKSNTFYTGRSADGSDMQEFEGMYVSSCGNFWGNHPFTKEQEKSMRKDAHKKRIRNLMNFKFKQQDKNNP